MSFESALEAARQLAAEFTRLTRAMSSLAVAEDHDPNWSQSDTAKLDAMYAHQAEIGRRLNAAISQMGRDHHHAWCAFLSASTDHLRRVSQQVGRFPGEHQYEYDQWAQWSRGQAPDPPAEIFARGLDVLQTHPVK